MSSISGLSSYNSSLSYASQLFAKASSTSSSSSTQESETDPYNILKTDDSDSTSASSTSETKRHHQTSSIDDATMSALIQGMDSSSSTSSQTVSSDDMIAAMDTDSDGTITQEEFVAARPDDVSEEMATNLWNSIDTEGAGSLTTDEVQTAMAANGPHGPPPPPPEDDEEDEDSLLSSTESTDSSDSLASILGQLLDEASGTSSSSGSETFADMISAMDTDSDGTVTQEEFVAARPDDVTEEMATNLWNSFDTEGVGSLSTSDLQTVMAENAPPMDGVQTASNTSTSAYQTLLDQLTSSSSSSSSSTDTTSSTDNTTSTNSAALQAFLEAVQAYDATAGYSATKDVLSSLMALA